MNTTTRIRGANPRRRVVAERSLNTVDVYTIEELVDLSAIVSESDPGMGLHIGSSLKRQGDAVQGWNGMEFGSEQVETREV